MNNKIYIANIIFTAKLHKGYELNRMRYAFNAWSRSCVQTIAVRNSHFVPSIVVQYSGPDPGRHRDIVVVYG